MIDLLLKGRTVLKHIIPWSKEEIEKDLDRDYAELRADKAFTLKKLEKELKEILETHENIDSFVKAKVIIDEYYNCHADAYFYFNTEDRWEQLVIPFDKKVDLNEQDKEKLELAPPLEIDFKL